VKRIVTIASVAALTAAGMSVAQPATAAKKYTACVKKSTGEMRLLLGKKKKCKKGWKKTSWTKAGPRGGKGAHGVPGQANSIGIVVDANGALVGETMSVSALGPFPLFSIRIDGGLYTYLGNGWLYPLNATLTYDNAACTGTPFIGSTDPVQSAFYINDPGFRFVYRALSPAPGPAEAWKATGQKAAVVALPTWYRNDTGVCTAGAALTGDRIELTPVTAPPDYSGPLRLV